ncbi:antifreeze protein [Pseudodonghicola xiamenensis]|nr:antifreeze protein [Pseudodonghicola xiamenensis]
MSRLWWRVAVLAEDAQCVVGLRLLGLSGIWSVPPEESHDMILEKAPAFTAGLLAGVLTACEGHGPDRVMLAVVGPISARARENRERLVRRGPMVLGIAVFTPKDDLQSHNGATAQ